MTNHRNKREFGKVGRLVVKVGSSLLSDKSFQLDKKALGVVVANIMAARERGIETVLVTSGAVAAGMGALGLKKRPGVIIEKQACAAVGQSLLMHEYQRAFSERGVVTAQVLLTRLYMDNRTVHQNVRQVFRRLMDNWVLPIVNENDVVSADELKFGDNDTLSGLVADLVEADMLILLTDVDGLYVSDGCARTRLGVVPSVTPEIYSHVGGAGSVVSTGGMVTKVQTAERMARADRVTVIGYGRDAETVGRILAGEDVGTIFLPSGRKVEARKRWIAYYLRPHGRIVIDLGAVEALRRRGGSLLPSGITAVDGDFSRGAAVAVVAENGEIVGQGLSAYSSADVRRIKRLKSAKIKETLGYSHGDEVIHRDDLVIG